MTMLTSLYAKDRVVACAAVIMTTVFLAPACALFAAPPAKSPAATADPKSAADEGAEPRRIQIWWGVGGSLGDAFRKQVELFNQSQSRVVATVRMLNGYGEVRRELEKSLKKGGLPDAAIVEVQLVASLATRGQIEPLDQFIKGDRRFSPDDLLPGVLTNLRYRGKLYALPINRSTPVLYYNKDRFVAAGLDPDKPPQTWEELRDMSETLASKDSRHYGFLAPAWPWLFESIVWSDSGELIVGGRAKFAEPAAKPLQLWADIVHRDKNGRFGKQRDIFSAFASGNAAMVLESTALIEVFKSTCPFKVGTAPVPHSEGSKTIVPTGGGAAVIPAAKSAESKAATWEFLTWLIETKQAAAWSRATGYIPVRESARALLEKDGFYKEHPEFETAIKELSSARESSQILKGGPLFKIVNDAMTAIVRDDSPALETLKAAEREADQILKANPDAKR